MSTSSCFGPFFANPPKFVQWPVGMDLRLHRLGVNAEAASVVRQLVSFWSPPKDGKPVSPIVWASAETLGKRLGKPESWVAGVLREFCGQRPKRVTKNGKPSKRRSNPLPTLLTLVEEPRPGRAGRYDLTPLWHLLERVDVSDVFPVDGEPRVQPDDTALPYCERSLYLFLGSARALGWRHGKNLTDAEQEAVVREAVARDTEKLGHAPYDANDDERINVRRTHEWHALIETIAEVATKYCTAAKQEEAA